MPALEALAQTPSEKLQQKNCSHSPRYLPGLQRQAVSLARIAHLAHSPDAHADEYVERLTGIRISRRK
jgi:hypothetical protein